MVAKILRFFSVSIFAFFILSCAGTKVQEPATEYRPGVIWQSEVPNPNWIYTEEPNAMEGYIFFVGLSLGTANEKEARNDAMRNTREQVTKYMGTYSISSFEKKAVSFGLSRSTFDPTEASKAYIKEMSENVTQKVKSNKWYIELRKSPTGQQYFAYVHTNVPEEALSVSLKDYAAIKIKEAQERAKVAENEEAKVQAENMKNFWESF